MLPHFSNPRILVGFLLILVVFAYAMWRGGRAERTAAVLLLVAWLVSPAASHLTGTFGPRYGIMAVDIVLLGAMLAIALRADRVWPLWAAAFLAAEVIMHLAIIVEPAIMSAAYVLAVHVWSYAVMAALAIGVAAFDGRRRRASAAARERAEAAPQPA